jgi:hypothetical protein
MQSEESDKWGRGRFTNEYELITRHCNIHNAYQVKAALNNLTKVNEGASTKFKLVFDQHGNKGGINNIGVTNYSANEMLQILYDKGYRDIIVSDLACHGGTAFHFKKIIEDFIDKHSKVNVTIYAAPEGRRIIYCNSNNGTKYRTIGTDGKAQKREKTVYFYHTYDEGERENAGYLTQKLSRPKQPHPSKKRNQSKACNQIGR